MTTEEKKVETPAASEAKAPEATPKQESQAEIDARGRGWVPEKEWIESGGDPSEWRSAREFNERGEWIGKFRAKDREIQQIKEALQFMTEQNKKIYAQGYETAITDLKQKRRQALAEGNLVEADEIGDKIEEKKRAIAEIERAATPPQPRVDPEFESWLAANRWYVTDPVMQRHADAIAQEYSRLHNMQVSAQEVRDHVAKEIRKELPHKFPKAKIPPQPDGEGRSGVRGKTSDSFADVESDMTDTQRQIMKTILKTTGMSREDYFKQFTGSRQ